jgi:hypothetical protein
MRQAEVKSFPAQRTVAVIGGITGLEPQYRRVLEERNFYSRIYNQNNNGLKGTAEGTDFIILFTATVSHSMALRARKIAHSSGIPLVTVKPSSVSALKKSLSALR